MKAVTIVPETSELTPLQYEAVLARAPRPHEHGEGPPIFQADIEVEASNGEIVVRTYRWQVTEGGNGPRAVGEWLRPGGGWSLVRSPDRCAQLLALTPAEHRSPR